MNEVDYLYLDREKRRIEYDLHNVLEGGTEDEFEEMIKRIEEYKALKFGSITKTELTRRMQELQDIAKSDRIEIHQSLMVVRIGQLASLLGVELEG